MDGLDDPVDSSIASDRFVLRIHQDDFEVLVGRVLIDPVRIEDTKVGTATANTFFRGSL